MDNTYINEMIIIYRILEYFILAVNIDEKLAIMKYLGNTDIEDERAIDFKETVLIEMKVRCNNG